MLSATFPWTSIPEDLKWRFPGAAAPAFRGTFGRGLWGRGNWLLLLSHFRRRTLQTQPAGNAEALEALGPDPHRHFLLVLTVLPSPSVFAWGRGAGQSPKGCLAKSSDMGQFLVTYLPSQAHTVSLVVSCHFSSPKTPWSPMLPPLSHEVNHTKPPEVSWGGWGAVSRWMECTLETWLSCNFPVCQPGQ